MIFTLMPPEPTLEMYEAGYDATRLEDGTPQFVDAGFVLGHAGVIYRAMMKAWRDSQPDDTIEKLAMDAAMRMWAIHPTDLDKMEFIHTSKGGKYEHPRASYYAAEIMQVLAAVLAKQTDKRHPAHFKGENDSGTVAVAHYRTADGPDRHITVKTDLGGARWREVYLTPDEAEQMAHHLLAKAAQARSTL